MTFDQGEIGGQPGCFRQGGARLVQMMPRRLHCFGHGILTLAARRQGGAYAVIAPCRFEGGDGIDQVEKIVERLVGAAEGGREGRKGRAFL